MPSLRFGLRFLIVLMTVAAIAAGYYAFLENQKRLHWQPFDRSVVDAKIAKGSIVLLRFGIDRRESLTPWMHKGTYGFSSAYDDSAAETQVDLPEFCQFVNEKPIELFWSLEPVPPYLLDGVMKPALRLSETVVIVHPEQPDSPIILRGMHKTPEAIWELLDL